MLILKATQAGRIWDTSLLLWKLSDPPRRVLYNLSVYVSWGYSQPRPSSCFGRLLVACTPFIDQSTWRYRLYFVDQMIQVFQHQLSSPPDSGHSMTNQIPQKYIHLGRFFLVSALKLPSVRFEAISGHRPLLRHVLVSPMAAVHMILCPVVSIILLVVWLYGISTSLLL